MSQKTRLGLGMLVFLLGSSFSAFASDYEEAEALLARSRDDYFTQLVRNPGASEAQQDKFYNDTVQTARSSLRNVMEQELLQTLRENRVTVEAPSPNYKPVDRSKFQGQFKKKLANLPPSRPGTRAPAQEGGGKALPSSIERSREDVIIDGSQFKKKLEFPGRNQQPGAAASPDAPSEHAAPDPFAIPKGPKTSGK